MREIYRVNFIKLFVLFFTFIIGLGISILNFNEEFNSVMNESQFLASVLVNTSESGDECLTFITEVGDEFLVENQSTNYTFGTLIYPTQNGEVSENMSVDENCQILDGVVLTAVNSQSLLQSFDYKATVGFEKNVVIDWIKKHKPNVDPSELNELVESVLEKLYAKNFTGVSYAITDNGTVYFNKATTSVNESIATAGVEYQIVNDEHAEVTGYTGTSTDVVIAKTYQGYPVTKIRNYAFNSNSSIVKIEISKNIINIGDYAFIGCSILKNISVEETNQHYKSIDGVLYSKDGKILIQYPSGKEETEFIVPNTVNVIGEDAFYSCGSLIKIEMKEGVVEIGNGAFAFCESLMEIIIPNSVMIVGYHMFTDCDSLTYNVKDNLRYLGNDNNKYLCLVDVQHRSVTTAIIDENCKFIIDDAFTLYNITSIRIPDSVIQIGNSAFSLCEKLTSVEISKNIKYIGHYAFSSCNALKTIKFNGTINEWKVVVKGYSWVTDMIATKVTCSDGKVDIVVEE